MRHFWNFKTLCFSLSISKHNTKKDSLIQYFFVANEIVVKFSHLVNDKANLPLLWLSQDFLLSWF